MKNHSLTLLLTLATVCAYAQSGEEKLGYVNRNGKRVQDSAYAAFFRTVEPKADAFIIRDYYLGTRKLQMEAECTEYIPSLIYHGKIKYYYANGSLSEEGNYKEGVRHGEFAYYHENGKPKEHLGYEGNETLYLQVYTDDGKELIANGRGTLTETDDDGTTIYTRVVNNRLNSCYKLRAGKDTVMLTLLRAAEYPGGVSKLGQDISANLKYPKRARKDYVEGTVYVAFIINKAGKVEQVEVIKGISDECDEEAMRVVRELKTWTPGIQRGKLVKTKFVLPLKFSLS
jgi:TonB family protein